MNNIKEKAEEIFAWMTAGLIAIFFMVLSIMVTFGVPIIALYIIYRIAKYLFTGAW